LSAYAANPNQGAESTLAYYQALMSLVGGGLAKLPAPAPGRPATEPGRSTVAKRSAASNRATTVTPSAASAPAPTAAGGATARGEAAPRNQGAAAKHLRPGNRFRTTEGPTDAR
jgi:hypothetical protein